MRRNEVLHDSPLEGDGFEPSVPQQIRSDLGTAGPSPITVDSLATRNWKFESISLQRRVKCEPDSLACATVYDRFTFWLQCGDNCPVERF
jgi:hypothetical protein